MVCRCAHNVTIYNCVHTYMLNNDPCVVEVLFFKEQIKKNSKKNSIIYVIKKKNLTHKKYLSFFKIPKKYST